jgi:exopolyphosphatase/guanosine-5'-triphosphate,3'-diphosphate pyrophosphatase
MYKAAIDIGTNSIRLLIVKIKERDIIPVYRAIKSVRIGRTVDSRRIINEDAIQKAAEVVAGFGKLSASHGCKEVYAVATSAVRDAENKDKLLQKILKLGGPKVRVISGDKEAQLTFLGAIWGEADQSVFVTDIGGGSTELVTGQNGRITFSCSIDIGAVRLKERFLTADPIDPIEYENMKKHIESTLYEPLLCIKSISPLKSLAVSGTVTNLAAIDLGLSVYDPDKVEGHILYRSRTADIQKRFLETPVAKRRIIPGLQPERADIIPAGTQILLSIMEFLGLDSIIVKESDILKGIIIDMMGWE